MRTNIRRKLTALIFLVNMAIIALTWFMAVFMFKPMYYAVTQAELGNMMNKVVTAIELDGGITDNTLEQITGFINIGTCVDIADANGNGIVLFEGIGDACQLHSEGSDDNFFGQQRKIDSSAVKAMRKKVRENTRTTYNAHNQDNLGNIQAIKGRFYEGKYTIIVSTNLARTESIVSIVSSQLQTASILAVILSFLIATIMSNWFMQPLMKLSNATKEIAKGNYDVKVEIPQKDEFGQLAKDFNLMTEEIQHSHELQRDLIANISHDLRTPLTIIKGYAESIKDITGDNKEIRDSQLTTIIEETDRLSNMVGSVMEYTKLSQSTYKLNIVQFDIADMCQDIVEMYSYKAVKDNKSITYAGPEQVYVFADAALIERVIHNFVSNALVHTPAETRVGVAINITNEGKVKVSVYDSGQGIKQEDIPHLFDKYYRARKDEGRTGSGLGLAIVKSILENHNFEYGVESREGLGTEFWFII
ncbi:MAG: HAMP domain-containing histidine kinase [Oscillospiraceae bacterium]|nr:HAMP domain-containing histidine kinase [Oscillospiraceae bacterium]MBQ7816555.1 HAMP domain-containing histidine kinase [Oscillospiraceae bacterium]